MMRRDFGAPTIRFHSRGIAIHDILVDAVLEMVARCIDPAQPPYVRVIFTKQEFRPAVTEESQRREPRAIDRDRIILACNELRSHRIGFPRPGVAGPELRQYVQRGRFGRAIIDRHPLQDVVDIGFCVFDLDIEIAVFRKHTGVDQLEFGVSPAATPVLFDKSCVGKCRLRVFVEHTHVRMGWRAVEVVVEFLDVFAVVALGIGQPKQPLLQDGVAAVPQGETETQQQPIIAKPADPVLAPAIGAAARMVVRKIFPSVAVLAVILAHRSPLALAEIGPPAPPMLTLANRAASPRARFGMSSVWPAPVNWKRRSYRSKSCWDTPIISGCTRKNSVRTDSTSEIFLKRSRTSR